MNTPGFGSATAETSATVRRLQAGSCCQAGLGSNFEQPEPVPPLPLPGGPQALSDQPRLFDERARWVPPTAVTNRLAAGYCTPNPSSPAEAVTTTPGCL